MRRRRKRWIRDWYRSPEKKAPPKHGIKVKKSGLTWWGQRWIEALERISSGYSSRLARGRTYARAGRTHDLIVKTGAMTARVTGSSATPYKVRIALARLPDPVWDKAVAAMAGKAQFTAELLAGQMPREIDTAFEEAGASLFPSKGSDLRTDCSCPDWANPCKHVAATHYVLGEAFDRDPFLLFELRGRTKDQILGALRAARAGHDARKGRARTRNGRKETTGEEVPAVPLGRVSAADYDKPRDALPTLHLSFEKPPVSGAVLRQLGTPVGWTHHASPAEMLGLMIRLAAARVRELAMAEPETSEVTETSVANAPDTTLTRSRRSHTPAAPVAQGSKTQKKRPAAAARSPLSKAKGTPTRSRATNRPKN
jgi:uncharacterized Zn finger protein